MPTILLLLGLLITAHTFSYGQTGILTGKIYSQVNFQALEDAKLVLKKDNKYFGKTQTDHVGNYWFGDLEAGNYSVLVVQDGYCQLEMGEIIIHNNGSLHLDLGLMENAQNSNVFGDSKVYLVYQEPIKIDVDEGKTAYQEFKNEIHIINEVYDGAEMRIAPQTKERSTQEENRRSSSFNDFLKGLEETKPLFPKGF